MISVVTETLNRSKFTFKAAFNMTDSTHLIFWARKECHLAIISKANEHRYLRESSIGESHKIMIETLHEIYIGSKNEINSTIKMILLPQSFYVSNVHYSSALMGPKHF